MFQHEKELPVAAPARIDSAHELANAMRAGCRLRPQKAVRAYFRGEAACALGAAAVGRGITLPRFNKTGALQKLFPILDSEVRDPENLNAKWNLGALITCLNDVRGWPRERIADWLDQTRRRIDPAGRHHQRAAESSAGCSDSPARCTAHLLEANSISKTGAILRKKPRYQPVIETCETKTLTNTGEF
jgi:hypothetical protein